MKGWRIFATAVLSLISREHIETQLGCFATIVRTLAECDCTEEANEVAQQICTVLQVSDLLSITETDLDAYFDAIIALYNDRETNEDFLSLERLCIPVFTGLFLFPHQQCRLLIELHDSCRLENTPSGHNLYKKMCRLLLHDHLFAVLSRNIIRQVITCYVELGDAEILELFIGHVFWGKVVDNSWIEVFLTTANPATLTLLISCLDKKTDEVKALAIEPLLEDEDVHRVETVGFFRALLHLQTFPQLSDSVKLDAFDSIYPDMPEDRLNNLIVDLLRDDTVKKFPSSRKALYNMARSLLGESALSRVGTIRQLLEEFSALLDDELSYSYQLVGVICLNCMWSQQRTINLLMETIFSSSDMWKDDNTAQLCLSDLMASWIAALERDMVTVSITKMYRFREMVRRDVMPISFRADFTTCFFSYIKETKKGRDLKSDLFSPLLNKMGMQELSHLIWDVYQLDIKDTISLKNFPKTLNMYRDLCLRLLDSGEKSRAWISGWSEPKTDNMILETTSCVLWLGDENSTSLFTNLILTSSNPSAIISIIIKSKTVLDLVRCLPHVQDSLCLILEKRLSGYPVAWSMPNVYLPEHQKVEEFLHSCHKEMTYANFSDRKQVAEFANVVELLGTDNEYAAKVTKIVGSEFNCLCQIVKVRKLTEESKKIEKEKAELEQALATIKSQFEPVADNNEAGMSGTYAGKTESPMMM